MTTVKQIDRLWDGGDHRRLLNEAAAGRPDLLTLAQTAGGPVAAAAVALIRLEELGQSHQPVASRLIRSLLAKQEADGGWGSPAVTALAVRALSCNQGHGPAIERGIANLVELQKPEGSWPVEAVRRLGGDELTTAFILLQVGQIESFRKRARVNHAVQWLRAHLLEIDASTRRLAERAITRCQAVARPMMQTPIWS